MTSANALGLGTVGSGAATGAAIGSIIPGVGTLIGGAIGGVVGGIAGSIGLGKKGKKKAKQARRIQQLREQNAQDATYLQMIRTARMARSGSLAASTVYGLASSSLATSALSSIGSQSQYSIQYTANDQRLVSLYNRYMKKAGDYAKAAQTTLAAGQLTGLALGTAGAFAGASAAAGSAFESVGGMGPLTAAQSAQISTAYSEALSQGLTSVGLWGNVLQPVFSGISQYNQY